MSQGICQINSKTVAETVAKGAIGIGIAAFVAVAVALSLFACYPRLRPEYSVAVMMPGMIVSFAGALALGTLHDNA